MKDYCKVGRVIEWSEDYPTGDIETICGIDEIPASFLVEEKTDEQITEEVMNEVFIKSFKDAFDDLAGEMRIEIRLEEL